MNLIKYIPKGVTLRAGRALLHVQKNSPSLLFGAGVVGVVGTTVLASRATLKLEDVLEPASAQLDAAKAMFESENPDYSAMDYRRDVTIIRSRTAISIAKLYAVPLALGVGSVACLAGSHFILSSRNMALTAAYATVSESFHKYRERVIDEFGTDKERELYHGVEVEKTKGINNKGKEVVRKRPHAAGYSMYARLWNSQTTSDWNNNPDYNYMFLRAQEKEANRKLHTRGHVLLNDVYDMLGLDRTKEGTIVGWALNNGDEYISFGIFDGDDEVSPEVVSFFIGKEDGIWLDFNVDGNIYDLI